MLASRRIGAIIAIEREVGLRNYIESGIPLDSTVTYDLLVSVFQTESPLHDGAVIIQENRVGGRLLLAADRESADRQQVWGETPRGYRIDRRIGRCGARRFRGDRRGISRHRRSGRGSHHPRAAAVQA